MSKDNQSTKKNKKKNKYDEFKPKTDIFDSILDYHEETAEEINRKKKKLEEESKKKKIDKKDNNPNILEKKKKKKKKKKKPSIKINNNELDDIYDKYNM
jgi:hypothetical protein